MIQHYDTTLNDTTGDPVMVKFAVFGKGLEQDVEEMSDHYLGSQVARKTMLICSLLDISNTKITDKLLEKCGVLEIANNLDGSVLRRYSDGSWKTKHTRWDLELFSFFYNKKSGTLLEQRKQDLMDSLIALYLLRDEEITYSVIEALYYIAAEDFVPTAAAAVESVFQQSKSHIPRDTSPMAFLIVSNASHIADAYYSLKRYRENIDRLDSLAIDSWLDKGIRAYALGNYEEAIKCCDIALEIDPSSAKASYLKGLALDKRVVGA